MTINRVVLYIVRIGRFGSLFWYRIYCIIMHNSRVIIDNNSKPVKKLYKWADPIVRKTLVTIENEPQLLTLSSVNNCFV